MSKRFKLKKNILFASVLSLSLSVGVSAYCALLNNNKTSSNQQNTLLKSNKIVENEQNKKIFHLGDLNTTNRDTRWKNIEFSNRTVNFQLVANTSNSRDLEYYQNTNLIVPGNGLSVKIDFTSNGTLPVYNGSKLRYSQWSGNSINVPEAFVQSMSPNVSTTFTSTEPLINLNGVAVQYLSKNVNDYNLMQEELFVGFAFQSNEAGNTGGVTPVLKSEIPKEYDTGNSPVIVNAAATMPSDSTNGIKLYNNNIGSFIQTGKYGYYQNSSSTNFFLSQVYDNGGSGMNTPTLYYLETNSSDSGQLDEKSYVYLPDSVSDFWKGSKNQLPSKAIESLTVDNIKTLVSQFETSYFTNSMLQNFPIEFIADDVNGRIDVKITIPYQICLRQEQTYFQYIYAAEPVNKVNIMSIEKPDTPLEITFSSDGFNSVDMTTQVTNSISMLQDSQFANYSINEILAMNDVEEKLKLFVMRHKNDIFNELPSDFTIENITNVELENGETSTDGIMTVTLNNYFENGVTVNNDKNFFVNLTNVYEGSTGVLIGNISIDGFNEYYAQASILKGETDVKRALFDPNLAKNNNNNNSHYFEARLLTETFKQQLLEKCITGKKDGITTSDIDGISIDWFNNSDGEPSICVSMIKLKKYYGNTDRNLKTGDRVLLNNGNKIYLNGFKRMDKTPLSLESSITLTGVNGIYPSQFDERNVVDKLNENLFTSIYSPNPSLSAINVDKDLNFDVNANYSIGQIKSISSITSDDNAGTMSLNGITAYNAFIQEPNSNQVVFYNEYFFNSQTPILVNGFRARDNETYIVNPPEGTEWGVLASDVRDKKNDAYNQFLQEYFNICVKNPQPGITWQNLSLNVTEVDNTRGYLKGSITINGTNPLIQDQAIELYGFRIQKQTVFKKYNDMLPSPEPMIDIYDFTTDQAVDIIYNNINLLVDGLPDDFVKEDIYLYTNGKNGFDVDYLNKCVNVSFKLRKFNNSDGELVTGDVENAPTSYLYKIGLFTVYEQTQQNFNFEYTVTNPTEQLTQQCYINPQQFPWLSNYVQQALLYQKEIGTLSLPDINTNNFTISSNSLWSEHNNEYAYALGQISLNVFLYKYYDDTGRIVDINPQNNITGEQPLEIKVLLKGWDVWNTTYKVSNQSSVNWGNNLIPSDDEIKQILWDNKDEFAKFYLYQNDEAAYKDNINLQSSAAVDGTSLSVTATVRFKKYFKNGRLSENSPAITIIITGFAATEMTTTFTNLTEININHDAEDFVNMSNINPSILYDDASGGNINNIPLVFRQLVFDKIVTGDKFNMTVDNLKSIEFEPSSFSNRNGTIQISKIVLVGYNHTVAPTYTFEHEFIPRVTIGGLMQTSATELTSDHVQIENNTAYHDLFNVNAEQLKLIVQRNIDTIFKNPLPNGINSVKNVELIEGTQNWLEGTVQIKITLSSLYDVNGNPRYDVDKVFPENTNQTITITNFAKPEPTKMPIVEFDVSKIFFSEDNEKFSTTIFASDVIDANWFWIQNHLIKAINEIFAQQPEKFVSPSIRNPQNFNQIAWANQITDDITDDGQRINYFYDPNANWNFLTNNQQMQQAVKDEFASAARIASDNPTQYNNDSYGRIELKVSMLKGIVKNNAGQIQNDKPLSSANATLTLRLYGFKTSNNYQSQSWEKNQSLLITILASTLSAFVLLTIITVTALVLRKRYS